MTIRYYRPSTKKRRVELETRPRLEQTSNEKARERAGKKEKREKEEGYHIAASWMEVVARGDAAFRKELVKGMKREKDSGTERVGEAGLGLG